MHIHILVFKKKILWKSVRPRKSRKIKDVLLLSHKSRIKWAKFKPHVFPVYISSCVCVEQQQHIVLILKVYSKYIRDTLPT